MVAILHKFIHFHLRSKLTILYIQTIFLPSYIKHLMFLRQVLLLSIFGWFSVNCLAPALPNYRKAEIALNRYNSYSSYNPIVHSLLNVLIHVKKAKAFISDKAIEMALEQVKEFDEKTGENNEPLLRQLIYGTNCNPNDKNCLSSNRKPPTPDVKQRITIALDKFFANNKANDHWMLNALNSNKV